MSSYIIAGSADSLDTAYCQQIARRIKAKYKNIDFRIVIKHPSEWEQYLNQICRIYGFPNKSNPIIYTYHGKIIGNKESFIKNASKYFGLNEQSLIVPNLSTAVNIKLANQQLHKKNIIKNNIKTLQQKIVSTYDRLLKEGILKHELKVKNQFLVNGIQYYFREVSGLCPSINYPQNLEIKAEKQNIEAAQIDLKTLASQDQIIVDQSPNNLKQAFVTNQNQQAIERMSEASKTNRLHSSVLSKDEDSKANKQSSQDKQKIEEQFDDVTDYTDINMENTLICELGDHFSLAFQKKGVSHIPGQMVFYHNEALDNGNILRIYNDGRPVIGHHTIVKEIHFIGEVQSQNMSQSGFNGQKNEEESQFQRKSQPKIIQNSGQNNIQNQAQNKVGVQQNQHKVEQKVNEKNIQNIQTPHESKKVKTQNVEPKQEMSKKSARRQESQIHDDAVSQAYSDINLISNLNYHTLYILRPLSQLQLRYILQLVRQTNAVTCLQFLPQNPNPKVKVYNRNMLLDNKNSLFPVQSFIEKQLQDGQIQKICLPKQDEQNKSTPKTQFIKINDIGFTHLYYPHDEKLNQEQLSKVLRNGINQILNLEDSLKKEIGYNLIISKKYTLIVALAQPYRVYGNNSLYFDGLAFLGYVQIAKVLQGYMLKPIKIDSGATIRQSLASSSAWQNTD